MAGFVVRTENEFESLMGWLKEQHVLQSPAEVDVCASALELLHCLFGLYIAEYVSYVASNVRDSKP